MIPDVGLGHCMSFCQNIQKNGLVKILLHLQAATEQRLSALKKSLAIRLQALLDQHMPLPLPESRQASVHDGTLYAMSLLLLVRPWTLSPLWCIVLN